MRGCEAAQWAPSVSPTARARVRSIEQLPRGATIQRAYATRTRGKVGRTEVGVGWAELREPGPSAGFFFFLLCFISYFPNSCVQMNLN
jgi:hypothetical protein